MRLPTSWTLPSCAALHLAQSGLLMTAFLIPANGISFTPVPSANLDLTQLGRVGLAGDFQGISMYEYQGQNENTISNNGSQSILARYPNGGFATLAASDASIMSMCSFVMQNGAMAGVIVAGNFTSLGGIESQAVAMFNPNTSSVTALTGLSGKVAALLCDQTTNTVYVGGNFQGAASTNAIAWVGTAGWTNLPFAGFNGPVTSITRAASGSIVFGGSFTGLGNSTTSTTVTPDAQIINISGATISAQSSTTTSGYADPNNIVCRDARTDAPGKTWLLADNTAGSWEADFQTTFVASKLRLWNTHLDGRGIKTFRYTTPPGAGIMNFTYVDADTGVTASCTSDCPLSNNSSVAYQDFHFVNPISSSGFRIDISAWYGSGGGLDSVELFTNEIQAFAINTFNEPSCANISTASAAQTRGMWTTAPKGSDGYSEYLTTTLANGSRDPSNPAVVFFPDLKQSGNYTVNIYTPGCMRDNTCSSRGLVNITGTTSNGATFQTEIYQTNNFDKYDEIYAGYIAMPSSSFRPSITLAPGSGQSSNLTVVAQRVGFVLTSAINEGLNGLFEWNPSQAVVNTSDFSVLPFDVAGLSFDASAGVSSLMTEGNVTYVGGNFSTTSYSNIVSVRSGGTTPLAAGGLNGAVTVLTLNGTTLYVGGNFSGTTNSSTTGLNNIAAYDTSANAWNALGAGVNGRVLNIVPLSLNVTANTPETVIAVSGNFNQLQAFGSNRAASVSGFGIWVASRSNWLQNLNGSMMAISGQLSTYEVMPSGDLLWAGSVSSAQLATNGLVGLSSSFDTFPISIQPAVSSVSTGLTKRASVGQNVSGVVTGAFYEREGRNVTVLGGHFMATATNGSSISNLAFINGSNSNTVTGVGSQVSSGSTILTVAVQNDTLFAGGSISGAVNSATLNGLVLYNLQTASFMTQPPALAGSSVIVYVITVRPNSAEVYVGGSFDSAGSLGCPGVCLFNANAAQWTRPGTSLTGTANAMVWASADSLIVGGQLAVNGGNTSIASYNANSQTWSVYNGAGSLPGPVTAMAAANSDGSQIWAAGTATNGSTYLMMYDGSSWNSVGSVLGTSTIIRGLQILSLTSAHDNTNLVPASQALLLTGAISVPGFGNASAVLFNGTTFSPFALTTSSSTSAGSLSQIFSQQQNYFSTPGSQLALGFVVLIGLAIGLALVFLIVVVGVLLERLRRKREGYVPAPTNMYDKTAQISRIPPDQLFGSVGHGRHGIPTV